MAEVLRVKARWSGFNGAPGYSVMHFRDFEGNGDQNSFAAGAADRMAIFFNESRTLLPYQVTIQVLPEVEVIEESTNQLVDVVSVTPPALILGTASAGDSYAAPVGAVVTWRTAGIRNGRRIKGRTFFVPASGTAFENNGTLQNAAIQTLNNAATNLISNTGTPDFGVLARPTAPGASDGVWFEASSFSVPDMGAVLRSRRS